jgi:hypothetical protein
MAVMSISFGVGDMRACLAAREGNRNASQNTWAAHAVERGTSRLPVVPLVHAGDAAAAAADVVQHRFGYFEPNAYVLQAGGDGSAQIVSGRV